MTRTTNADGTRFYTVPDGQGGTVDLPSVTTVLQVVSKPLHYWAANQVAQYAVDNLPEIVSLVDKGDRDGAYDLLKRAPWRKRDKAAEKGTSVHALVERIILGDDVNAVDVDPAEYAYVQAFRQFVNDYGTDFEASEMTVFNLTLGYAGTLDALLRVNGRLGALDWKVRAGKKAASAVPYETELLQVAAYVNAEYVLLPDGTTEPMPAVDGGTVVMLCEDGPAYGKIDKVRDFEGFQAALALFKWKETRGA